MDSSSKSREGKEEGLEGELCIGNSSLAEASFKGFEIHDLQRMRYKERDLKEIVVM